MEQTKKNFKVVLTNGDTIAISGISKVVTSTPSCISVVVDGKTLDISGSNLTTNRLDVEGGILEATGEIFGIKFAGKKQKQNFFKRIFG